MKYEILKAGRMYIIRFKRPWLPFWFKYKHEGYVCMYYSLESAYEGIESAKEELQDWFKVGGSDD